MKNSFSIENLLTGIENPKGPLAQTMFAQQMSDYENDATCDCLVRINFENTSINKAFPGCPALLETLLFGSLYEINPRLHLYIRGDNHYLKVATCWEKDHEVTVDLDYQDAVLVRKLSEKDIKGLFDYCWENTEVLLPKRRSWDDDTDF